MKYFYLDKNYAKNGIVMSVYSNSKPEPYYIEQGYAEYIGDSLPIYIYYDEAKDLVRPSTLEELITLGVKKLEPNQILEGGNIRTFNTTYEYIENNEIKSKTREMLVVEGIEKPFDNEYIKNGKLKTIPKKPKDMVKGEFDFTQEQWIEKATPEEIEEYTHNKTIDFYNSELEFASKANTELSCGIITPEMFEDVKVYMKAIDPYAPKVLNLRRTRRSTIERPLVFDRYK